MMFCDIVASCHMTPSPSSNVVLSIEMYDESSVKDLVEGEKRRERRTLGTTQDGIYNPSTHRPQVQSVCVCVVCMLVWMACSLHMPPRGHTGVASTMCTLPSAVQVHGPGERWEEESSL